jgi:hypothetical protein
MILILRRQMTSFQAYVRIRPGMQGRKDLILSRRKHRDPPPGSRRAQATKKPGQAGLF